MENARNPVPIDLAIATREPNRRLQCISVPVQPILPDTVMIFPVGRVTVGDECIHPTLQFPAFAVALREIRLVRSFLTTHEKILRCT